MILDFYKRERELIQNKVSEYELLCYDDAMKALELLCKDNK